MCASSTAARASYGAAESGTDRLVMIQTIAAG